MPTHACRFILSAFVGFITLAHFVNAGDHCCAHCGCTGECHKVCRLVYEEKSVDTVCWGAKQEDFCIPGPSERGCKHCDDVCDECGEYYNPLCGCVSPRKFIWFDWTPDCAKVHTKTKLMKKVVTRKIPSYKWVVEDLCSQCTADCPTPTIEPGVKVPPPPVDGAKVRYGQPAVIFPQGTEGAGSTKSLN